MTQIMHMQRISDTHASNVSQVTQQLVASIMNSVEGLEWPSSAEWCVEYTLKTWPMGMDSGHVRYFDDKVSMDTWLEEQEEWACQDDNEITYAISKWDLGPTHVISGMYY